jgi:hypothetical protein
MRNIQKLVALGLAVSTMLGLNACSAGAPEEPETTTKVYGVQIEQYKYVDCRYTQTGNDTDLKCSWNHPSVSIYDSPDLDFDWKRIDGVSARCVSDDHGAMDCDTPI